MYKRQIPNTTRQNGVVDRDLAIVKEAAQAACFEALHLFFDVLTIATACLEADIVRLGLWHTKSTCHRCQHGPRIAVEPSLRHGTAAVDAAVIKARLLPRSP